MSTVVVEEIPSNVKINIDKGFTKVTKEVPNTVKVDNSTNIVKVSSQIPKVTTIKKEVIAVVNNASKPSITVHSGGRGLGLSSPGSGNTTPDLAYLLSVLQGAVTEGLLTTELNQKIERPSQATTTALTGLQTFRDETEAALLSINTTVNTQTGDINQLSSQVTSTSEQVTIYSSKVDDTSYELAAQRTLLNNQYTLKFQESVNGETYCVGSGLILYPDWQETKDYSVDDYVWFEGSVYKCLVAHTSSELNTPGLDGDKWQHIPNGRKSQFTIQAEEFAIVMPDGTGAKIPFIVRDGVVAVDGNILATGSVTASAIAANSITADHIKADEIYTLKFASQNYEAGISGYILDPITGIAEFNNIQLQLNYLSQDDLDSGLDTTDGGLIVRNSVTQDYAHLSAGDLNHYYWNGTEHELYQSVNRLEVGVVENGVTTEIPGIFRSQPKVLVTAASLQTYNAAQNLTDQKQVLSANDIVEDPVGSGKWKFTPRAELQTAVGSNGLIVPAATLSCSSYNELTDYSTTEAARIYGHRQAELITTPVTSQIRIFGNIQFTNIDSWARCYVIIDGTTHLLASLTGSGELNTSSSVAVDSVFDVVEGVHTVGILSQFKYDHYFSTWVKIKFGGWSSSCSYIVNDLRDNGEGTYPVTLSCSVNPNLNLETTIAATNRLAEGSLLYFALGK